MGRGELAGREDGWGVGDEGSSAGELDRMGMGDRGVEPDSLMRETMKHGVQRLCLLPGWWR